MKTFANKFCFSRHFHNIQKIQLDNHAKLNFHFVETKDEKYKKNNMIVLHGFMGSHTNFRSIVKNPNIAKYTNTYLIDQRNHGFSQHKSTMSPPEMAFDIRKFIEEHKIEGNIYLMGHSMGGRVVMNFLQNYPELHDCIKGAIIVDILPDNYIDEKNPTAMQTYVMVNKLSQIDFTNKSHKQIRQEIDQICLDKDVANFVSMQLAEKNSEVFDSTKYYWRSNMKVFADSYKEMISHSTESTDYTGPVKVICGDRSTYVNRQRANTSFPRIFKNIDVEKDIIFFENATHWVHAEKSSQFINEVSQCLKNWHQEA